MVRHREDVESAQCGQAVAAALQRREVASEGCRVTRDVGDDARRLAGNRLDDLRAGSGAGWVEHDDVEPALGDPAPHEPFDPVLHEPHLRNVGKVASGVLDGAAARLNGDDGTGRADPLGEGTGEQADAREEVPAPLSLHRSGQVEDGSRERVGGTGMDLPEVVGRQLPAAPRGYLCHLGCAAPGCDHEPVTGRGDDSLGGRLTAPQRVGHVRESRRRDPAVVDSHHLVRAMLAKPWPTVAGRTEPHPGPPAQTLGVSGDGLHDHRPLDLGEPAKLLLDDIREHQPLALEADVLEVASSAGVWSRVRTRGCHPVARRGEDFDAVCAKETRLLGSLGDLRPDPLTRDGVPDEDHPALVTRNAVAAVRDGAYLDLHDIAHQ